MHRKLFHISGCPDGLEKPRIQVRALLVYIEYSTVSLTQDPILDPDPDPDLDPVPDPDFFYESTKTKWQVDGFLGRLVRNLPEDLGVILDTISGSNTCNLLFSPFICDNTSVCISI